MKRALVLGATGMDGSHLCDILLAKGYEVHAAVRRSSTGNLRRIQHCLNKLVIHHFDMTDPISVDQVIRESQPHEIYNEADQDNVGWSFETPLQSFDVTYSAVGRLLEIVRCYDKSIKVFQPCTAMMFGDTNECPQNEETKFSPQSPYAVSKVGAYHLARFYRQAHGMFVCTAILFNHDSPRRSEDYLLHKICVSVVRIARGQQESLALGNLGLRVDVGYAPEFMEAAHFIMQLPEPDDFIIGTGEAWSISEMVNNAWATMLLTKGTTHNPKPLSDYIRRDLKFYKDHVGTEMRANISKAQSVFGFDPQYGIDKTINILIDHYSGAKQ